MKQVTRASCRNEHLIRLLRGKVFAHRPQLFSAMGAARDDKEGGQDGVMRGFRPVVREFAGVADDPVIMKSIALGWPDETFPANAVVSERKSVAEATVFVGFEE